MRLNVGDRPYIVLPPCVSNTNGVDELVEKACCTTKPLEYSNSFGTNMEWEQFDKESCQCERIRVSYSFVDDGLTISKSIICNIVCRAIKEDKTSLWVSRHLSEQGTVVYAITAREGA